MFKKQAYIFIALLLIHIPVFSQNLPVIPVPKPATPNRGILNNHNQSPDGNQPNANFPFNTNPYQQPNNNLHNPNEHTDIQRRNEALRREVHQHQRQLEIQKENDIYMLANYGFPSQSYQEGTEYYYQAFDEISAMLNGKIPQNLGRAVFLMENAYHNNSYDYVEFLNSIKGSANLCNTVIKQEKLDPEDNVTKNMMIFRMISDTIKFKDEKTKQTLTSYPIKYNYDDYTSQKNYDSHFVTTLMKTGKGQCQSMPLYYLIIAEQMGAEAYWSFSPKHSFVKIQDERGVWYNLELTCSAILSDAHYMNNSYIKAEAIRNRIYLEPMDKTNVIAEMLVELTRGYFKKYGLDDFTLQCLDTAMEHLDNDVSALKLKSEYERRLTLTLAKLLDAPKPEIMKQKSPEAYTHFEKMQALYTQIDNLGYEDLPEDLYARWLKHIESEKAKSEKLPSIFHRMPKE
ncbi:MAG: hypothetical protein E6772_14555 [Dysgonomonas sp.]|nr:hypothetical protein [Dysgonomonas sp.]